MTMPTPTTVTVEFPDGPREVAPDSWNRDLDRSYGCPVNNRIWKPELTVPRHRVVETVDGRFIAVPDMG